MAKKAPKKTTYDDPARKQALARPAAERRNLRRIDQPDLHGWQVVIQRRGKVHTKFFNDAGHDGEAGAFNAATAHRDAHLADLPPADDTPSHLAAPSVRKRAWKKLTRTKVKGLGLSYTFPGSSSKKREPYIAAHLLDAETGAYRSRTASVERLGAREALRVSIARLVANDQLDMEPAAAYRRAWPRVRAWLIDDLGYDPNVLRQTIHQRKRADFLVD